ncbi:MAG: DUF2179 domain-containing protein [Candidatus Krumholzibacteria bacterium]|nr:DUF2179 domain-containing protein [Candidatus Krumholzibacteria bacterium]
MTVLIFFARISDVTLGTLRIVFISKGQKYIAPAFAFFEMLIWLFAVRQIMQNLDNAAYYFAYAFGFASGVFVGLNVEERLAMGLRLVRTITRKDASELVAALRDCDFGVTSVEATGNSGKVNILYSVIKRSDADRYIGMVKKFNPRAFFSVEDIRFVSEGVFPQRARSMFRRLGFPGLRGWGKIK